MGWLWDTSTRTSGSTGYPQCYLSAKLHYTVLTLLLYRRVSPSPFHHIIHNILSTHELITSTTMTSKLVSQKCSWPLSPAPCHSALKPRINSQLVESVQYTYLRALDHRSDRINSCDHRSPIVAAVATIYALRGLRGATHCEESRPDINDFADCTATTPRALRHPT